MKQFILMADIINSSEKSADTLMKSFSHVVDEVNTAYSERLVSPLTITLGDEFQGLADGLKTSIEVIFALDEAILAASEPFYLRYILHYGEIATPINREKAYGMLGEGLTTAREALGTMKKEGRDVLVSGLDSHVEKPLNLAFVLYRSLYTDWYPKDRQIVYDFLQHGDYKKVATLHERDNSSMWRKEKSLKIEAFTTSRELINLLADEY